VTTTKNIETPARVDGTGLAEVLLGLDGFRELAVTETPAEVVIEIETTADRWAVRGAGCGPRLATLHRPAPPAPASVGSPPVPEPAEVSG
jgi:hypothetical protein